MSSAQTLYFMGVVGSLAGLLSWSVSAWIPLFLPVARDSIWSIETIDSALVGSVIGLLCVGFADHWSGRRIRVHRFLIGFSSGGTGGTLGTFAQIYARNNMLAELPHGFVATFSWILPGALIGLTIGMIRSGLFPRRLVVSLFGGGLGAAIGATSVLVLGESYPFASHATGLMVTGLGISLGSTSAIYFVRRATLRLVHYDDSNVGSGLRGQEWELLRGDRYHFGSTEATGGSERYVQVRIPDPKIRGWIASLREASGEFFLQPHPENRDASGKAVYPLEVKRVNGSRWEMLDSSELADGVALRNGDLIRMGGTWFRFTLRGWQEAPAHR